MAKPERRTPVGRKNEKNADREALVRAFLDYLIYTSAADFFKSNVVAS